VSPLDLITIQNVKDWLNSTGQVQFPTGSDQLLQRLVTAVSAFATKYLQRTLQPANYSEVYNGFDTRAITLRNSPVISVSSVTLGTQAITARTQVGSYGYAFDSSTLYMDGGGIFCRGVQNVAVSYRAGLQQTDATTVASNPSASPLTVTQLSRPWNSDQGVAYSMGAPFTPVTVPPTVAGTYQLIADSSGTAQYNFATADAGAAITVTYGYTPEDVVQALVEIAGERFKARSRIGEVSQNLGHGQVVSFSRLDMNESIRTLLNPWRVVTPIP
jgi:hypothetical protein